MTAAEGEGSDPKLADAALFERVLTRISGGFVLALHNILPSRLSDFIEGLRPCQPISLTELVQRRSNRRSNAGLFAITVDDGVGENVRVLTGLCRAHGWPATFYLPTQYLDTGQPMAFQYWWSIKPLLPRRRVDLKTGPVDLSVRGLRKKFCHAMERTWYVERAEAYLPVTIELAKLVGSTIEVELRKFAPITWNEVEELSRDALFQFESHGVSHVAMSALSEPEIAQEMGQSRRVIEEHTGRPCRHFCYPFGSPESIGQVAPKIAARYYDSAVTLSLGSADRSDPWRMRRIPLYSENSLLLARIKVLLACAAWGRRRGLPHAPLN